MTGGTNEPTFFLMGAAVQEAKDMLQYHEDAEGAATTAHYSQAFLQLVLAQRNAPASPKQRRWGLLSRLLLSSNAKWEFLAKSFLQGRVQVGWRGVPCSCHRRKNLCT